MSESTRSHSHKRKKRRIKGSYRGNKLVKFLRKYRWQLVVMALLLVAFITVLVFLISELSAEEEYFIAAQLMNRM